MNTGGALEPGFLESFSLLGKSALHFPDAEKHDEAKFWRTAQLSEFRTEGDLRSRVSPFQKVE
jgi:hypothetical protein